MANIFISYSKPDFEFAETLRNRLQSVGHTAFFSGSDLSVGERWRSSIEGQLRNADAVVVLISEQAAIGDRPGGLSHWLVQEVSYTLGMWRESGRPIVLPILLDDIDIPSVVSDVQVLYAPERNLDYIVEQVTVSIESSMGRLDARNDQKRETLKRVEDIADKYISDSITDLRNRESRLKLVSTLWYWIAFLSLVSGFLFAGWRALQSTASEQSSWEVVIGSLIASVFVLGFSGAISRFAFTLGKSYMVESLRNSDRIHAISFGQFYLKAFGEDADWNEIKEAFQHWNIDKGSSFMTQDVKDINPEILKNAIEIAKSLSPVKK